MTPHQRIRAGGGVRRYHTRPIIGEQTVAAHSWGVAVILLEICEPSPALMRAALYHDVAEYETGDVPATAKWANASLKTALDAIEREVEGRLGISADGLSAEELFLLKVADMFELLWFCVDQRWLGNRGIAEIFRNGCAWCDQRTKGFPEKALAMYSEIEKGYRCANHV
jgi:5'-deoxynucleotidase YfbR-like HD superfamily hydrolase